VRPCSHARNPHSASSELRLPQFCSHTRVPQIACTCATRSHPIDVNAHTRICASFAPHDTRHTHAAAHPTNSCALVRLEVQTAYAQGLAGSRCLFLLTLLHLMYAAGGSAIARVAQARPTCRPLSIIDFLRTPFRARDARAHRRPPPLSRTLLIKRLMSSRAPLTGNRHTTARCLAHIQTTPADADARRLERPASTIK